MSKPDDATLVEELVQRAVLSRQGLYRKALLGQVSPRQAIKAKCQECVCWEEMVSRIGQCTVRSCPIWAYRPYQDGLSDDVAPLREEG
jgi:hypothetical protein